MAQEAEASSDQLRTEEASQKAADPPLPTEAEPPPLPSETDVSYVERAETAAAEAAVAAAPAGKAENIHAGLSEEEQDALLKVQPQFCSVWLAAHTDWPEAQSFLLTTWHLFYKKGTDNAQGPDGSLCPAGVLL